MWASEIPNNYQSWIENRLIHFHSVFIEENQLRKEDVVKIALIGRGFCSLKFWFKIICLLIFEKCCLCLLTVLKINFFSVGAT